MSAFPTLSSSSPLSDWFANVTHLCNLVQAQSQTIQTLQERIAVLENHARIIPMKPAEPAQPPAPAPAKEKKPRRKPVAAVTAVEPQATATAPVTEKKRGRKPAEVNLAAFLREGEQIIARIPLGDRRFDEHAVTFQDGHLTLEDGQTFEHPTTLCAALAKMLEDIGERSTECSKSVNGWLLCTASRDGKRVPLDKLKPADGATDGAAEAAETTETVVEGETEGVFYT
jgi:hypothetical protein